MTKNLAARGHRDIRTDGLEGRRYVATIGVDRYRSDAWRTLRNAVNDAHGTARVLATLGFEPKVSLLDESATRSAFFRLTDDLKTLSPRDSLVVFVAGHGYTEQRQFSDGVSARFGYVVPADADGTQLGSLVPLDIWLHELARLPPLHILVILDCCGSGIALSPRYRLGGDGIMTIRGQGLDGAASIAPLRSLQSRRVITSALNEQPALDDGPIADHSLFTGCLISALSGELFTRLGRSAAASSELFTHVRDQVWKRSRSQQTPDFGALELDERGELVLEQSPALANDATRIPAVAPPGRPTSTTRRRLGLADFRTPMTRIPIIASRQAVSEIAGAGRAGAPPPPVDTGTPKRDSHSPAERVAARTSRPAPPRHVGMSRTRATARGVLEPAFVAMLDRHQAERGRGRPIVSIISADALAATTSWAAWAARLGMVTLVTAAASVEAAASDLLAGMPWLRLLREARTQVAAAAGLELAALDNALRDAAQDDCSAWVDDVAGEVMRARVAGWLLSWSVAPWGSFLDPATAPVQGPSLLSAVCELAAPIAVLFHHKSPDAAWLSRALHAARELADYMPRHAVAVVAPEELLSYALDDPSTRVTKLRRSVVPLTRAPRIADATEGRLCIHSRSISSTN